jgi:small subunit ribosomal protein S4
MEARQLVRHRHFLVNGKAVDVPSYTVKKGDVIEVREKSRNVARIQAALEGLKRREVPQWLESESAQFRGRVRDLPARDDVTAPMEERLIVELYSK